MVFLIRAVRQAAIGALLAAPLAMAVLRAQATLENDVKAAFLYNFTKFVDWPGPPTREPFRVCILADADFTASVDNTIAEETVNGRKLVRVEPHSPDDVRGCAILYVGRSQSERGARLLAAVRDSPVLTVGDTPHFLQEGGAIAFVLDNNRVRFDISTRALQRAGLKASSKLLRVARNVDQGGGL